MKRILLGLGCWLVVVFSLCGSENLPLLMQYGKYEQVKSLVEAGGADLEATDRFNRTVLHWAALANADLIPLLLEKGADIEAPDGSGMTPLHHAVSARNTAAVEKLIEGKADIRATSKSQNAVLHFACRGKDPKPEIITLLLGNGADVNAKDNSGTTPFMLVNSSSRYSAEVIGAIFSAKPDVNAQNNQGETALMLCIRKFTATDPRIPASMLAIPGIKLDTQDKDGNSAMHIAAAFRAHQAEATYIIDALGEKKANPNLQDKYGRTPLFLAIEANNAKTINLLLDKFDADPNLKHNDGNCPVLLAAQQGDIPLLKALIRKKADLNVEREDGATPLVLALRKNAMRDFLIASGVDLETHVMDKGMKILHFAIENFGDGEPACYLLEKGANPNSTDMFGDTPLHYAARCCNHVAVKALLAKNVDVNKQNKKGETPIFLAASRGNVAIVNLLLKKGAKLDIKNKKGKSVLDYASGATRKLLKKTVQ
ncbi:MAG: ankyrin repeat domain-containing protein [Lentisphaeria bacterium]|nr:ankyrin repeat domain-containing protein [Lentisphaeria bacterium]